MPSTITWRGDAAAVAQVDEITVTGTWATADVANIIINGKTITFTVGATETVAAVVAGLVAAWNASTIAECTEITATDANPKVKLTADTAGIPFTVTVSETTAGDGSLGTVSVATASAGPKDLSTAANFSGGALPGNGDTLVFENSANDCIYGLEALAAVTSLIVKRKQSYTGLIGLPLTNATGKYIEYRPRYLKADFATIEIGEGEGNGSGRFMIDANTSDPAITVFNCGTQQSVSDRGTPAVIIKGTTTGATLDVIKGTVGVAIYAGDVAVLDTVKIGYYSNQNGDSSVICGSGVTLTTVTQTGGKLDFRSNVTTFTQNGGQATIGGAAAITTITIGGTVYDGSSGTFTTASIRSSGVYDHRRSLVAKTITNAIAMAEGAAYHDPYGVVTASGGWTLNGNVELDLGVGKTLKL